MYLEYFGLKEKPFNITPNPHFIFLSKTHREVFAHLLYGIRNHAGFIEVTGEVGTGKTTVLRTLFGQLGGEGYRLAFIFNPSLSALELLRAVNREFGLACEGCSAGELLHLLNHFLLEENRAGRTVVLVIDEAQNLDPAVLEQIRLISNLETETDKLIQIVLVGQPELGRILGRSELRQLSQRITVRYHLQALDFDDTCAYVEHRLGVAGWTGGKIFSAEALRLIHRQSRGVPRLINVLCDRALVVAYSEERREVTAATVRQAGHEMRRSGEGRPLRWSWSWALALTAGLLLMLALVFVLQHRVPSPDAIVAAERVATPLPLPASPDPASALSPLLALWQVAPLPGGQSLDLPDGLAAVAAERSLGLLRVRGPLPALLQLDTPALLRLSVDGSDRYVAVIGREGAQLQLAVAGAARTTVLMERVMESFSGEAYLLWRNPLEIATRGGAWREPEAMGRLQRLLTAAHYPVAASGRYDEQTRAALLNFQQMQGLVVDGVPGPQTLLALYQSAGTYDLPRLSGKGEGR